MMNNDTAIIYSILLELGSFGMFCKLKNLQYIIQNNTKIKNNFKKNHQKFDDAVWAMPISKPNGQLKKYAKWTKFALTKINSNS